MIKESYMKFLKPFFLNSCLSILTAINKVSRQLKIQKMSDQFEGHFHILQTKGCGNVIPVRNEVISPYKFTINPLKNHHILKKIKWKFHGGIHAHFTK